MKTLSLLIAAFFTVSFASAQYNNGRTNNNDHGRYNNRNVINDGSIVTITLRNNANDQVLVDGNSYPPGTGNAGANIVYLTKVGAGQHSLQVTSKRGLGGILNGRRNTNNNTNVNTTFTVRSGYDMQITLNQNGNVRVRETRSANYNGGRNSNDRDRDRDRDRDHR